MSGETPEPAATKRPSLPTFVAVALTIALVWLGGQFIRQGVSDSFLDDKPGLSVLWQGDSSDAIGQFARAGLKGRDPQASARLAVKALQRWPLNAPALTTYALAMDQLKRPQAATAAMDVAARLGWRDNLTQVWLFRRELLAGRYVEALNHGDALLRRQFQAPPVLFQILGVVARDPKAAALLTVHLAANPIWRAPFFDLLMTREQPPPLDTVHTLLAGLVGTAAPPTDDELRLYLGSLVRQGKFQQAITDWRQLSPGVVGRVGGVIDGDFERPPGPSPFDWLLRDGVGWTASIDDSPSGSGKALKVEYDGVSPSPPLIQLLVLAPGAYRLTGRAYDAGGVGSQTLSWTLTCVGADAPIAQALTPSGTPNQWRAFSVDLTVPASGCPAQGLRLVANPGDVREDVAVWYDDLAVSSISAVAPKAQAPGAPSPVGHLMGRFSPIGGLHRHRD
jgi:hypothetical protein